MENNDSRRLAAAVRRVKYVMLEAADLGDSGSLQMVSVTDNSRPICSALGEKDLGLVNTRGIFSLTQQIAAKMEKYELYDQDRRSILIVNYNSYIT
jgi:hypothetical protein